MEKWETYHDLFLFASKKLIPLYGEGESISLIHWLMEEILGCRRTQIALREPMDIFAWENYGGFEAALERLVEGEPIQYILGTTKFMNFPFHVEPGVLIPREETEELVKRVASQCSEAKTILDIGTGSGCIAISLALLLPAKITAWDISASALEIARSNAARLEAHVRFEKVDALGEWSTDAQFDVIVSNPPYVLDQEKAEMHVNVLNFEPSQALFVPDDDPLLFYRAIVQKSKEILRPAGRLFFEINERYGREVQQLCQAEGFKEVRVVEDIFDKERIVEATFPGT